MSGKNNFSIKEITSKKRWEELLFLIDKPSIFDTQKYQAVADEKLFKVCIFKGNDPYAVFYSPTLDDEIVDSEYFIHSGTRLLHQISGIKKSALHSDLFTSNALICEYICDNFSKIKFRMHPDIIDLRPFLWKNYDNNLGKFLIDIRYTLIVNISEMFLKKYEESELFSNFDRNIARDIKKGNQSEYRIFFNTNLNFMPNLYVKTFERNGKTPDGKKVKKIYEIVDQLVKNKLGLFSILVRGNDPIYFSIFAIRDNKACHLYGGGDYELLERQDCSVLLWESFKKLSEMGVYSVDLEGINSPKRGSYKLGFGGKIVPYYELSWNRG